MWRVLGGATKRRKRALGINSAAEGDCALRLTVPFWPSNLRGVG